MPVPPATEARERRVAALMYDRAVASGRDLDAELRVAETDPDRSLSSVRIHRHLREILEARR